MTKHRSPSDFFSWRSPGAKRLNIAPETCSDDQLIELMLDNPRFIRRPIIIINSEYVIGANYKALEGLIQ